MVASKPKREFKGTVVHAEHTLSISGAMVCHIWLEWECGEFCHEAYDGEFPIPSREAALGVEGRCVMVSVGDTGLVSLAPCPE